MRDPRPPILWTRALLLTRIRRIARPALAATALWLSWVLLALALRDTEGGHFLALLLLGLFVLGGGMLAALWAFVVLRRQRLREAAQQGQLIWLTQTIQPHCPFPPPGTYSADADVLVGLWQCIREQRPLLVLELGSGLSTLIMAYALRPTVRVNSIHWRMTRYTRTMSAGSWMIMVCRIA